MALEKKIDLLLAKVTGLKSEVGGLKSEVGGLKSEVGGLKGEVGEFKTRVAVGFDETHRLIKLSLEGLAGLEETTVMRFDRLDAEHSKQFELLETFGVHVRKRVEAIEARPKK